MKKGMLFQGSPAVRVPVSPLGIVELSVPCSCSGVGRLWFGTGGIEVELRPRRALGRMAADEADLDKIIDAWLEGQTQ